MIEGVLETVAIYMSSFSGEPTCSLMEQIPFKHFVEIPGLKLGMQCIVKCSVDSLNFSPMNSQMIDLRVVINVSADAYKQTEKRLVNKAEEVEGIAKRYNTTVDALVKLNNIENPSKVTTGMQIMILKSVRVGKQK